MTTPTHPNDLAPPMNHVFVDYENVHQLDHSVSAAHSAARITDSAL
jgi:hypothetical protein